MSTDWPPMSSCGTHVDEAAVARCEAVLGQRLRHASRLAASKACRVWGGKWDQRWDGFLARARIEHKQWQIASR
jgi:hypothetical protein